MEIAEKIQEKTSETEAVTEMPLQVMSKSKERIGSWPGKTLVLKNRPKSKIIGIRLFFW